MPDQNNRRGGAFSSRPSHWDQVADAIGNGRLAAPTLHDLHALKLLLRGESVVDWHRLHIETEEQLRSLFWLNGLDLDDPDDQARLQVLRDRSLEFIRTTLRLKVQESLVGDHDAARLPMIASFKSQGADPSPEQRDACLLLKVMHVMHHLEARELRTQLPIADNELFVMVEDSVLRTFDALRAAGLPTVEFAWSRKQTSSLVTKLLLKKDTIAAKVFDRLRFRVIVQEPKDLEPTLRVILQRCIPFNFIVPGQTVNTLIDDRSVRDRAREMLKAAKAPIPAEDEESTQGPNEYSSDSYRILNFVADLPVRVDRHIAERGIDPITRGRVVFVLAEFQICDQATADANEEGQSAHVHYKARQLAGARERLLRRPPSGSKK